MMASAAFGPIPNQMQVQPQNQNQIVTPPLMQQQIPTNPVNMSFDTWDVGSDYGGYQPMLDQFPDYDWAASFDFSNQWPTVSTQIPGPGEPFRAPTGYNFG
jgi:transcriptional regulatory protein LEU3